VPGPALVELTNGSMVAGYSIVRGNVERAFPLLLLQVGVTQELVTYVQSVMLV
jgi:hypothetical protein